MLLDQIQKRRTVDWAMVQELHRRNLVEGRYPNVYISATVTKSTDQQAEYTKHRAFDNQYYKDMIIRSLE